MTDKKTRLRYLVARDVNLKEMNDWFDKHPEVVRVHALALTPLSDSWGTKSNNAAVAMVYEEEMKGEP